MGFCVFNVLLVFALVLGNSLSQDLNSDGAFISDFLREMGVPEGDFNFAAPFCSWRGVFCDTQKENVLKLELSGSGLSGVLPENTFAKLKKLQSMDLSNNSITGFSSDFWGLGGTLLSLNLSSNRFFGILPSNIGNFGFLKSFDLSFNNFSGEIPASLSSLLSLQVLALGSNSFEGNIPVQILSLKFLVAVDLSLNRLVGEIPQNFSASLTGLKALNLAGNGIQGRISDFSGLISLESLNISGNFFEGPVLGLFQESLKVLDISKNQFQGHISQISFNSNWPNLVFLDMSLNQLSGEIFTDLNKAHSLKHLNLAHNRFSLQKFPLINDLKSLERLNLSDTGLTGPIPQEISELKSLHLLDLSLNFLTGTVPSLTTLDHLDLSYNNLSGEIPSPLLESLPSMEKFNFSYNNLTICYKNSLPQTFPLSFLGSTNGCPIAADPNLFQRTRTRNRHMRLELAITIATVCFLAGLVCLAFGCRRRTRLWAEKQVPYKEEQNISGPFSFQTDSTTWVADVKLATSVPVTMFEKPLMNITFADLLAATSHFDRGTLLAEGRYGPVYRGVLPGGIHVAVKVLINSSSINDQEAASALEHLGKIKHPNLVPLTGYCLAGDQRIAIYKYMEHGNLQNMLHDLPIGGQITEDWSTDTWEEEYGGETQEKQSLISWRFRHRITLGTARAIAFLHHGCSPPIIHRDVKASSIYLDAQFEPRLSDFGLAKIAGIEPENERFLGSPEYKPPEFDQNPASLVSEKSDVYAFGVVLIEVITGKKPLGDEYGEGEVSLVSWVRGLVRKKIGWKAIDQKIIGTGSQEQMEEGLRIGYLCTAESPLKRPDMHQIVGLLKDIEPVGDQ
ncbi:probable LRR receptor-like serine/threonine-protein kinase At2g24230 [Amborella trichopoda]|nr:probable LRR receptor-like serine/threonine-protein kinase At2g24230 [Amborella trichopoda]|eukprot:XP_006857225.2 probable LRR receptor-like serine/threonine-protein kinase At2g24230 [Amborella trichopoda]